MAKESKDPKRATKKDGFGEDGRGSYAIEEMPDEHLAILEELAAALQRSDQEASEALDRALTSIEATRKQLDSKRPGE